MGSKEPQLSQRINQEPATGEQIAQAAEQIKPPEQIKAPAASADATLLLTDVKSGPLADSKLFYFQQHHH